MRIEDDELRLLFQAECEEHLQALEEGLLRLEASPDDGATLQATFRAAHSLKGAARMLGIGDLEVVAHESEEVLGTIRRGQAVFSSETVDRLSPVVDAMRAMVQEAVTGEPAAVDTARVLAQLRGDEAAQGGKTAPGSGLRAQGEEAVPGSGLRAQGSDEGGPVFAPTLSPEPLSPEPPSTLPEALTPLPGSNEVGESPEREQSGARGGERSAVPAVEEAQRLPARSAAPNGLEPAARAGEESPAGTHDVGVGVGVGEPLPTPTPTPTRERSDSSPAGAPIETIRVPSQRLDALMVLAGELVVTTSRLRRGLAALEEIGVLWKEKGGGNEATLADDVERLGLVAGALEESIQTMRLLPLSVLFHPFPRLVRDVARTLHKEVRFVIEGGDTTADKRILEELKDPLMHMIRNAVDHGIEPPDERQAGDKPREATLALRAYQTATSVVIELADDGRGLDLEAIRRTALQRRVLREEDLAAMSPEQIQSLIFAPGFSTSPSVTALSGRGVGLDVVRANVERLKGSIQVESHPGEGCRFQLRFPITLATTRVLLARVGRWSYALPVEFVEGALLVDPADLFTLEGRQSISVQDRPVPAVPLADLLELPVSAAPIDPKTGGRGLPGKRSGSPGTARLPCILLSMGPHRIGLLVDALLDEQEVMLKPLGGVLKRVRNVSGATILSSGEVCMVLNCQDLLMSLLRRQPVRRLEARVEEVERPKVILLVEDSITTRTQEKRILEGAGYEVFTAVDGVDALDKLGSRPVDAVVSDIEMPNLDGLSLTARIRENPEYHDLPVILVTTLSSEEDRRRGVEAGANAYITKATFDQRELVETVRRLV